MTPELKDTCTTSKTGYARVKTHIGSKIGLCSMHILNYWRNFDLKLPQRYE